MPKASVIDGKVIDVAQLLIALNDAVLSDVLEIIREPAQLQIGPQPPDPWDVVLRYDEIALARAQPAFTKLRSLFADDPIVAARVQGWQQYDGKHEALSMDRFIASFVGRVAFLMKCGVSRGEAISDGLRGFEVILRRNGRPVRYIATVPQLPVSSDPIHLGPDAILRRATDEERDHLYPKTGEYPALRDARLGGLGCITLLGHHQSLHDSTDVFPGVDADALEHLNAAVAFVQVFVDERLRPERLAVLNALWLPTLFGGVEMLASTVELVSERQSFSEARPKLEDDDRAQLPSRWASYSVAMKNPRFRRAAARYCLATQRVSEEDAVIDLCIALESLFGSSEGPVTDTLARRFALALGSDVPDRKRRIREIKGLYGVRSALVHGDEIGERLKKFLRVIREGHPQITRDDFGVVPFLCRHWVRHALTFFAAEPTLLESLDDLLLTGGVKDLLWLKKVRDVLAKPTAEGTAAGAPDAAPKRYHSATD